MAFERPQITMSEYIREVEISDWPRILVEGRRDKLVAERLLESVQQKTLVDPIGGRIRSDDGVPQSTRDKVCQLCSALSNRNVIGLVDREFDGFSLDGEQMIDGEPRLCSPNCMMTRGHSIENYVFRAKFFWEGVKGTAVELGDYDITKVESLFQGWLPQLATLSLTGRMFEVLGALEGTLGRLGTNAFNKDGSLDIEYIISCSMNSNDNAAEGLLEAYTILWEKVSKCPEESHQWLVAGHIGMRALVSSLERFFGSRHKEDDFFMSCIRSWIDTPSPERDNILQFFSQICPA